MNTDEKLYTLMAQAEDLQVHAEKLQNEAQDAFKALPHAVEQAGQKIRSTGLLGALFLLAVGMVFSAVAVAGIWWSTSQLRDEAAELHRTIATLKQYAAEERRTLQELEGKTWGLKLLKIDGKRWIRFKKGDEPGTTGTWENGKWHGIEVKP